MTRTLTLTALLVSLTMAAAPAMGWIIQQVEPDPGAGLAEALAVPLNLPGDPDVYEIHKYFMYEFQPLVLTFTREAGDQDTLQIVDEIILNLFTAEQRGWNDYHVLLEKDPTANKAVAFVDPDQAAAWQSTGGQSRLGGAPAAWSYTEIAWYTEDPAQYVPYGSFSDAPANQLVLRGLVIDVSDLAVGESFRLKQWPSTPEPTIIAMLYAGMALVAIRRHDRRG